MLRPVARSLARPILRLALEAALRGPWRHAAARRLAAHGRRRDGALPGAETMADAIQAYLARPCAPRWATLRQDGRLRIEADHAGATLFLLGLLPGPAEGATAAFLARSLAPGDVFLDVGANLGVYTVEAARRVAPGGRVVAVDAQAAMVALLRETVAALPDPGMVTVVHGAVAATDGGRATLRQPRFEADRGSASILDHGWIAGDAGETVATVTLDALVARLALARVDVVKMDIEGAEGLAIAGMTRILATHRPRALVIELTPARVRRGGRDVAAAPDMTAPAGVVALLRAAGYTCRRLDPDGAAGAVLDTEAADALETIENVIAVPAPGPQ